MIRIAAVCTAFVSTPSIAAVQVQGWLAGTMRVLVVSGHLNTNPVGIFPEVEPITNLAGATGTVSFRTTAYTGVERDYYPYGEFTPYYTTFFSLRLDGSSLPQNNFGFSGDNYEPDPGEVYHRAGYTGNYKSGFSFGVFSINSGYSTSYSITFARHGRTGSGNFNVGNEDFGTDHDVGISFQITSGSSNPVPEPGLWTMFIGGFGLLGSFSRRRRSIMFNYA